MYQLLDVVIGAAFFICIALLGIMSSIVEDVFRYKVQRSNVFKACCAVVGSIVILGVLLVLCGGAGKLIRMLVGYP